METAVIRQKYLDFFQVKPRLHRLIPSAPLVPKDDPTTLFTSSGMQALVPYLKGKSHPLGKRLVNSQLCFRAEDIEEVGDNRHTTFFEMLGNWSLGDYFKEEQLAWLWEFLLKQLSLPRDQLYVSVFEGSRDVPRDEDSARIWQKLGVAKNKIFYYSAQQNWWSRSGPPEAMPTGEIGGPDSEVFFEFKQLKHDPKFGKTCHPNCQCGRFLEISNSVFIEYEKQADGSFKVLPQKNVDFGGGLERLAAASQNLPDIFQIDSFEPLIQAIVTATGKKYELDNRAPMQVIADHLRAAVAMVKEGIEPSNKLQGYILRRLIRRAAVKMRQLCGELKPESFKLLVKNQAVLIEEINNFRKTLERGLKEFEKLQSDQLNESNAFNLFQTYGFPFEVSAELFRKKGKILDKKKFNKIFEDHKKLSRTASAGMFKSGLVNHSAAATKLHTTTHLLHQTLRQVLGNHVRQEGSQITPERLRFDFSHPKPLTAQELKAVEDLVNQKIKADLPVKKTIESKAKALASGALAFFSETYPEQVSVYSIGDFSKELCAGPHVTSTGQIGSVKIIKQDSIGAGKRRLYAVITNGT